MSPYLGEIADALTPVTLARNEGEVFVLTGPQDIEKYWAMHKRFFDILLYLGDLQYEQDEGYLHIPQEGDNPSWIWEQYRRRF